MEGKELAGKYLRKGLCNFFSLQNGYTTFVSHNKKPFSAYSKQKSATMQLRSPVHAKRWGPGTLRPTVDQRVLFGLWEAEESFSAQLGHSSANARQRCLVRSTAGRRATLRPMGGRWGANFANNLLALLISEIAVKTMLVLKKDRHCLPGHFFFSVRMKEYPMPTLALIGQCSSHFLSLIFYFATRCESIQF